MQLPSLQQANEWGVKGLLVELDMDPRIVDGQYTPFSRPAEHIPAVYVNTRQGLVDKAAVKTAPSKARIRVRGTRDLVTTDHLVLTLPATVSAAGGSESEVILVNTHTDGPSVLEENGAVALWALFRHFVPVAERPRDIVFLFAKGKDVRHVGSGRRRPSTVTLSAGPAPVFSNRTLSWRQQGSWCGSVTSAAAR